MEFMLDRIKIFHFHVYLGLYVNYLPRMVGIHKKKLYGLKEIN